MIYPPAKYCHKFHPQVRPHPWHIFSNHIWDLILAGNLCAAPLYPTHAQIFSPMLTLLLDPYHGPKLATHPALPDKIFASFQDALRFINRCKWFLMSVYHPTYSSFAIALQGSSILEYQTRSRNLTSRWQDLTIQTAQESYQILELVRNFFATLSNTT